MANLTTNRLVDPIQDIRREFDQLFERFLGEGYTPLPLPTPTRTTAGVHQLVPQLDMRMDDGQLVIKVDLPGVPPDEVDIMLHDGMLTIRGEREDQHVESRGGVQIRERRFGEFERRIRLPEGIDENSIQASFDNGVLTITARMKPGIGQQRHIPVSPGQKGQTQGKVSQGAAQQGMQGQSGSQARPAESQRAEGQSETSAQTGKGQAS